MMDMQILQKMLTEQLTEAHFEALLQVMDRLHDAATVGELESTTPMDAREVMGWLDDIIFTAEEVARELQATVRANEPKTWSDN
jgi:hypothetical protein